MTYPKSVILFIVVVLTLLISGYSNTAKAATESGKIYFVSNTFGDGVEPGDNTGTCVLDNDNIKKLYRYHQVCKVSRDGKKMAVVVKGKNDGICVIDIETDKKYIYTLKHLVSDICWYNNNNNKLLYVGYELVQSDGGQQRFCNIYELEMETKKERIISRFEEKANTIYGVSVAPNNQMAVFSSYEKDASGNNRNVRIVDIETSDVIFLPFGSTNATWSPFDDKIYLWGVYRDETTKEIGAHMYVYDVNSKTYKSYPKIGDYFSEDEYTFSPDGKRVAYYRWENDGRKTLWTMNPDRTDQRKLIDWRNMISDLSWTE